jgi:cytochrome P450
MAVTDTEVFFNPFADGFAADPYPQYAAMRAGDPVHHSPIGVWMVFGYDDVRRLLRDPALSVEDANMHETPLTAMSREALGELADMGNHSMLNVDPPDHTRLRRLVSKAFTLRVIERLRGDIQRLVDDTLDRAGRDGGLELMDDLAFPLPFAVITRMLGMPDTDTVELRRLSGTIVRSLEPVADVETLKAIAEAAAAMRQLVADAIEWKRSHPADDLLSALIAAEDDGDVLSPDELLEQVVLLYIAGHETTVNLIGNGVLSLLRHPDQLALLRRDPSLDGAAVEELLRYDSPVQMSRRIPVSEIEVGGKTIEPGAFVMLGLASANRDGSRWGATADDLDLNRDGAGDHVSFGGGHHYCLGAALARLEAQVAIPSLLRRFPTLTPAAEPVWNGRLNLRGLSSLPLSVG